MSALPSECSFLVSCPALRDNLLMNSQWSQGEKGTASISEAQASIEVLSPVPGNHLKMHGNASGLPRKADQRIHGRVRQTFLVQTG
jgi:hypothetical protein